MRSEEQICSLKNGNHLEMSISRLFQEAVEIRTLESFTTVEAGLDFGFKKMPGIAPSTVEIRSCRLM